MSEVQGGGDAGRPTGPDQSRRSTVRGTLIEHRFLWLAAWDCLAWTVALFLCTWLRYEMSLSGAQAEATLRAVPVVAAIQIAVGLWQGLYLGRWHLGSFEEIAALLKSVIAASAGLFLLNLDPRWVPKSVPLMAMFVALVLMAALRYGWRLVIEQRRRPSDERAQKVIVAGAGDGATQAITAMLHDPDSPYLPVAIVDDDYAKARLRVRGIAVRGQRTCIAALAAETGATVLLVAIPSADGAVIRELAALGEAAGLQVMVLPRVTDVFDERIGIEDIRPVTTEDLLGRREIDTDIQGIAGYLTGKRVLVTGAGGSIGSELCRQVHRFGPAELVMLDRDESGLHAVQLSIEGQALLESRNLVVADIRDRERLQAVFDEHDPEVVFHAAALKHLPLCELYPEEAVKTNVFGSAIVLDLALAHGVESFVNISTDKAADPTSVLGATKRVAERLTAAAAQDSIGSFVSVRFGNVLGSRGSVLGAFEAQIQQGGPITVTDEDVTRYFMTVEEAVQLVIQAGAIGENGGAMVLDMGEPVRIVDVARRLASQADRTIDIVFTGLRPGEKLHEVLHSQFENPRPSNHPLIAYVDVEPLSPNELGTLRVVDPRSLNTALYSHAGSVSAN